MMKVIDDLLKPLKLSLKRYSSDPSLKQAKNVTKTMWYWGDKTYKCVDLDFNDNGYTNDCVKGCDYCCFQNVRINIFEAMVITDWIRNNLDEKKISNIYKRTELLFISSKDDTNDSERWNRRQSCPCLDQESKTCIIYEVRPLECRLAISHDKIGCQSSFDDKTTKSISVIPPSGVGVILPKETKHQNLLNSISDYVTISLVESISDYLMSGILSQREISGKFVFPKTNKLLISMTDMELSRTLKYTLNGDTNQRIKSLVRLKPEEISECAKITTPMV